MKLRFVSRILTVKDIEKPIKDDNILKQEDITLKEMEIDREGLAIMLSNTSYMHDGKLREIAGRFYDIDKDVYAIMIYTIKQ